MKKILALILLLVPLNTKAVAVTNMQIQGTTEVTTGEEFYLSFLVGHSGVQKGTSDTYGIGGMVFELEFDTSVLSVINVSSSGFDSKLVQEGNEYAILSVVNQNNSSRNYCVDEFLYCADYLVTIKFYVNDTDKTSSKIKIGEVDSMLYKVNSTYDDNALNLIETNYNKSHTINIKKTTTPVQKRESIVSSNSVNTNVVTSKIQTKSSSKEKTDNLKSTHDEMSTISDIFLNTLEIEGYNIKFDKEKLKYNITVDNNINTLNIKAESEDGEVKIIGADDLKANGYKVIIEVAKDENKKTYQINVDQRLEDEVIKVKHRKKKENHKLSKKAVAIISMCIGILIIMTIIIFIIKFKYNNDLNKQLEKFDQL